MMTTRTFACGDVLSITTGRLTCVGYKYPIDGVYEILGFLTGDTGLMTHQLPKAMDAVRPRLVELYPETDLEARFGESVFDDLGPDTVEAWLAEQIEKRGVKASYDLEPVDTSADFSDPIGDFRAMNPNAEVIAVTLN